ncbi:MAG: zinc-ribbon domain-containing protein [Candidatus Methanomethylophilaceae archaeon]|nr:zinc-ribbon domain-containing protein [Candidatus Methanomethylophilaceae archaeon]
MDQQTVNRFGMIIMVIWLMVVIIRLFFYSSIYHGDSAWFGWLFNILLIGGVVLLAIVACRGLFSRAAAKANAEGRCKYCYAKLDPEDVFCPVCGAEDPRAKRIRRQLLSQSLNSLMSNLGSSANLLSAR